MWELICFDGNQAAALIPLAGLFHMGIMRAVFSLLPVMAFRSPSTFRVLSKPYKPRVVGYFPITV